MERGSTMRLGGRRLEPNLVAISGENVLMDAHMIWICIGTWREPLQVDPISFVRVQQFAAIWLAIVEQCYMRCTEWSFSGEMATALARPEISCESAARSWQCHGVGC